MTPAADPTQDLRWVPVSLMATYVGVSPTVLWRRLVAGEIPPNCTRKFGRTTRWLPAAYFAEAKRLAGVA